MIKIQTRQQANGYWWCNATVNGYDYSFEDVNIIDAQMQMVACLLANSIYFDMCIWEPEQLYPT